MVKSTITAVLAIAVLALGSATAAAGNGRGQGSSSVCDDSGLIGSAYAACHVYCESLDCDAEGHRASDRACEQALARFLDVSDGEQPPCVEGGGEPQGSACPCAFGWRDPDLLPEGWQPSMCEIYDAGEGGYSVMIVGDPGSSKDVMITAGWSNGVYSWGNAAGFACSWSSSDSSAGTYGGVDFGDQNLVPGEALDATPYRELFAGCEVELEAFLARFGLSRSFCTVIGN